ncbi:uncharacterized protein LODBEIA_P26580 [Lodderomyces beijingensis]|uniref:Protein BTN n=1 Tax=Lodderomyces beijingensis TaxID=1775926 RepID=A0ABP0ZKM6_9ASCO
MLLELTNQRKIFISFFIFGLLNNILYVIILSAAIDLVGSATPKASVLLADVVPSFGFKLVAPFFIHLIPYKARLRILVALSSGGMLLISLTSKDSIAIKIIGIMLASLSSGMGEVTFLQLTHYFTEDAVGGFSSGTGGAGLFGSFLFLLFTNIMGIRVWVVLLAFAVAPLGFLATYYFVLPTPSHEYHSVGNEEPMPMSEPEQEEVFVMSENQDKYTDLKHHIRTTMEKIKPLLVPFMLPLVTVYIAEYVINQGISPTLLFPLDELPHWLFASYRDIYVVYNFLYQLGVFISRTSVTFGIRIRHLYLLSILQAINVVITLVQSVYDFPFTKIWLLLALIIYEGLLGGAAYVNTFVSVREQVPQSQREFCMGSVSISDSLGIVLAGLINWWLEPTLCDWQVQRGRDWCLKGGSA